MKLGKPKRYTLFRNASDKISPPHRGSLSHSVIIPMANPSATQNKMITSMSSWLLVPKGRNFRHILATVLCVILVYHVTLLAIPTNSIATSSSSNGAAVENNEINSLPAVAAALTVCKSCEEEADALGDASSSNNQISQPQQDNVNNLRRSKTYDVHQAVGTSATSGSQASKNNQSPASGLSRQQQIQARKTDADGVNAAAKFPPPETSGNYYTDDSSAGGGDNFNNYNINSRSADNLYDSDNQFEDERATTRTISGQVNHEPSVDSESNALQNQAGTISKSTNNAKRQSPKRVSKKLLNVQYQKRKKLLDSIFLSIKSTKRFHKTRLEPVINTWFNLAKDQTWIFTDDDDPEMNLKTNGHIINTHCPSTHYRQALCCKMSAEFDTFMKSQKSWFCHFDDDNYVNVPALLDLLSKYDHKEEWYLGKPSLKSPIKIPHPDNKSEEISFWFATGGAGFCLSRALAKRMSPVASGGKFTKLCDSIQLPDDVTMGYIAGHLLGRNLTVIPQFHSHFETMRFLDMKNPHPEITFSYVRYADNSLNTLEIDGFTEEEDPTRFLSLHCLLFPNFSFCPKSRR